MANSHGVPDTMYELQATSSDLLPACIRSTTFPAVPAPPSLTLAAFATKGYVVDGPTLVYVDQEAHTVTLTGADGNYWLALTQDTFTTYASYTRVPGTHYAWRASATEPASVDGLLVFCQLTVAGGAITAVTPLTKVTSPPMSKQNSSAVAITGGTAGFDQMNATLVGAGTPAVPGNALTTSNAPSLFQGPVGMGATPTAGYALKTGSAYTHLQGLVSIGPTQEPNTSYNLTVRNDLLVANGIGINKTTAVGFNIDLAGTMGMPGGAAAIVNTSSRAALKRDLTDLTGALATLLRLRPRTWTWADAALDAQLPGPQTGFVVEEVADALPAWVTTGTDGTLGYREQGFAALVVGALKELLARLEALEKPRA